MYESHQTYGVNYFPASQSQTITGNPIGCRSDAVRKKMTRSEYASRNAGVESLRHIPIRFFEGLYDEIAIQGLPINDRVPLAPVPHSALNAEPNLGASGRIASAFRPLVRSVGEVVRERTGSVFSWMRRSVVGAVVGPVLLYRA